MADAPIPWTSSPSFAHLIKWAEMAVRARVEKAIAPLRLTSAQLLFLVLLEELEDSTPAALARAMHVTPQGMTKTLRPLDARGLIARRVDETHRKRVLLSLTPAARVLLTEVRAVTPVIEADLLAGLSAAEADLLRAMLMRIASPFDRDNGLSASSDSV
jgi:DNA-binding MarR family transcriptional regulator